VTPLSTRSSPSLPRTLHVIPAATLSFPANVTNTVPRAPATRTRMTRGRYFQRFPPRLSIKHVRYSGSYIGPVPAPFTPPLVVQNPYDGPAESFRLRDTISYTVRPRRRFRQWRCHETFPLVRRSSCYRVNKNRTARIRFARIPNNYDVFRTEPTANNNVRRNAYSNKLTALSIN